MEWAFLATGGRGGMGLIGAAQQALFAGYSRTDERGADKEGFYNTVKAGFNPYAMLITASKLEDLAAQGGGANYGLFSSHPEPEERVKRINKYLKEYDITPMVVLNDNGVATITMKNINYKRTAFSSEFIHILNNAGHSENFDVVIVLEGTNTVEKKEHIALFLFGILQNIHL